MPTVPPSQPPSSPLRIGQLKDRSGVPVKTIRYYEELDLIHAVARTEGGFRLFDDDAIHRLAFIKRSQTLGLSLAEIGDILQIHDRGEHPCQTVTHTLNQKIQAIDQQIQELTLLRKQLRSLLQSDHPAHADSICPIIEASP